MLLKAAADFVTDFKSIILIPIVMTVFQVLYILFWLYGYVIIFANGDLNFDEYLPFGKLTLTTNQKRTAYVHWFALLWNIAFMFSASQFIITCTCCIWYFAGQSDDIPNPIYKSVWWLFRYHLGSIAFGGLILAIVWLFRIIAEYIHVISSVTPRKKSRRTPATR